MAKRRPPPEEENGEEWMATYADTITLLLCFFVILLSVSEPKMDKFEAISEAMSSGFVKDMIELPFKNLYDDVRVIIEENAVEVDVAVEFSDKGVKIDVGSGALFAPGSAKLLPKAEPLLKELAIAIREMNLDDYNVQVEGHTDNSPINSPVFPSNWELSALRAAGVTRFLIDQGIESQRMKMDAFADTQPKVNNMDAQGKPIAENQAQNRRIVIHVMRADEGSDS